MMRIKEATIVGLSVPRPRVVLHPQIFEAALAASPNGLGFSQNAQSCPLGRKYRFLEPWDK